MNLYESKAFVRRNAAVRGSAAVWAVRAAVRQECERCERQYVAVCMVVCAQCAQQCVAVFLVIVYGSVHGSVRQFGVVRQCAVVCGSVRQCAAVRQCVAVRAAVCGSVWQCVAVRMAVCGSAHGRVWQCALRILVCPWKGSGNEPHHPCIFIWTNRSIRVINTN
jgi:hypothetical protein